MSDAVEETSEPSRRGFLVRAGALLVAASATGGVVGCDPPPVPGGASTGAARATRLSRTTLDALADAVLPESIGAGGRQAAVARFVEWAAGFEPVAQEMLGYGYADVRYLPPDPVPAWQAQLDGLERLAQKRGVAFAALTIADRRALLDRVVERSATAALPAPLEASHVALALLAHWASGSEAWDLALGVQVQRERCRSLATTADQPRPLGDA